MIEHAERVCTDYAAQGYDLTLRQLYYRFVAAGMIENTQRSYKRLGEIINKARMAGLLDWSYIVDRTRNLRGNSHWNSPQSIMRGAARSYAEDKWADQPTRVEVWVEKEALAGIVGQAAQRNDVDWFSCRGYGSQSEVWGAAQRFHKYFQAGQSVVVIHLGDHDPSGIDMTRDIRDRLGTFTWRDWARASVPDLRRRAAANGGQVTSEHLAASMRDQVGSDEPVRVNRIVLNMDQVQAYDPPPNPAKLTDSRAQGYVAEFGLESWELDALDPATLDDLIDSEIRSFRDDDLYEAAEAREQDARELLEAASGRWREVATMLRQARS